MWVGSEKYLARNHGERLEVLDHLPLLLFHVKYTISPTINVMSTAPASANPTVAPILRGQDSELCFPSESPRPTVMVVVVVVVVVAVVVMVAEKT